MNQLLTYSLNIMYFTEPFNGIESGVFGLIILKSKLFNSSNADFTSLTSFELTCMYFSIDYVVLMYFSACLESTIEYASLHQDSHFP